MNFLIFNVMTCYGRHDAGFVFMACFWRYDTLFGFMTNFLSSWCALDVMTKLMFSWRVLTTSWRTFWLHDVFFDVMKHFVTSWRVLTALRTFWFLMSWRVFMSWRTLWMSWRTFWRHDKLFDFMTHILTSWRVFDVMTHFLKSWSHDRVCGCCGSSDITPDIIPPPPGFPPFSWPIVVGIVDIEQSCFPFGDDCSTDVLTGQPDVEPPFSPITQAHDSESVGSPDVGLLVSPLVDAGTATAADVLRPVSPLLAVYAVGTGCSSVSGCRRSSRDPSTSVAAGSGGSVWLHDVFLTSWRTFWLREADADRVCGCCGRRRCTGGGDEWFFGYRPWHYPTSGIPAVLLADRRWDCGYRTVVFSIRRWLFNGRSYRPAGCGAAVLADYSGSWFGVCRFAGRWTAGVSAGRCWYGYGGGCASASISSSCSICCGHRLFLRLRTSTIVARPQYLGGGWLWRVRSWRNDLLSRSVHWGLDVLSGIRRTEDRTTTRLQGNLDFPYIILGSSSGLGFPNRPAFWRWAPVGGWTIFCEIRRLQPPCTYNRMWVWCRWTLTFWANIRLRYRGWHRSWLSCVWELGSFRRRKWLRVLLVLVSAALPFRWRQWGCGGPRWIRCGSISALNWLGLVSSWTCVGLFSKADCVACQATDWYKEAVPPV